MSLWFETAMKAVSKESAPISNVEWLPSMRAICDLEPFVIGCTFLGDPGDSSSFFFCFFYRKPSVVCWDLKNFS